MKNNIGKELIGELTEIKRYLKEEHGKLKEESDSLKKQGGSEERRTEIKKFADEIEESFYALVEDINDFKNLINDYNNAKSKDKPSKLSEVKDKEKELSNKYFITLSLSDYEEEVEVESVEKSKSQLKSKLPFLKRFVAALLALAGIGGLVHGVSSCQNNKAQIKEKDDNKDDNNEKDDSKFQKRADFEFSSNMTDPSNDDEVNARVDEYFEKYFNEVINSKSNVVKETITKESIADIIKVVNGKIPEGFDVNELINYNNELVQAFINYNSLEGEQAKFIPTQYLYADGSHEQKCAKEQDDIMKNVIKAINEENNEDFIKYSTEFGKLMKDQFYQPENTDEHFNVRSIANFYSRIHLYGTAYANYTANIMEYGLKHNIDICIPFCIDYTTNQYVDVPLSKLMAILEFVPPSQWDAVIQRAGMTPKQLEALGNNSTEDTMTVTFTRDAKNGFRDQLNQKKLTR